MTEHARAGPNRWKGRAPGVKKRKWVALLSLLLCAIPVLFILSALLGNLQNFSQPVSVEESIGLGVAAMFTFPLALAGLVTAGFARGYRAWCFGVALFYFVGFAVMQVILWARGNP